MSDLSKLDAGDWLGVAATGAVFGIGAAMAWFSKNNEKRDAAYKALGDRMDDTNKQVQAHVTRLAVLQEQHERIEEKLIEIKQDIVNSAFAGAHSVNTQLAWMVSEVQKMIKSEQRKLP